MTTLINSRVFARCENLFPVVFFQIIPLLVFRSHQSLDFCDMNAIFYDPGISSLNFIHLEVINKLPRPMLAVNRNHYIHIERIHRA